MITKEDIKKAAYESNLGHSTSHNDSFKEGVYWALEQVKNCSIPVVVEQSEQLCDICQDNEAKETYHVCRTCEDYQILKV